jgi:hypothetical protein
VVIGRSCFCEKGLGDRIFVRDCAIVLHFLLKNQRYNMFKDKTVQFVMAYESYNQLRSST